MDAAGRAEQELGVAVEVVKKGSPGYALEGDPPPCPSVMVNGELVAEGAVAYEVLRDELLAAGAGARGAP
jgi:hypothetical protein